MIESFVEHIHLKETYKLMKFNEVLICKCSYLLKRIDAQLFYQFHH